MGRKGRMKKWHKKPLPKLLGKGDTWSCEESSEITLALTATKFKAQDFSETKAGNANNGLSFELWIRSVLIHGARDFIPSYRAGRCQGSRRLAIGHQAWARGLNRGERGLGGIEPPKCNPFMGEASMPTLRTTEGDSHREYGNRESAFSDYEPRFVS